MKKIIIFITLLSSCFMFWGCNKISGGNIIETVDISVASETNKPDYKSALYFLEYNPDNLAQLPEESGGVSNLRYTYPLDLNFLFIESRLVDYVGRESYHEWTDAEYANGTWEMVNVLTYIEHFELTKEQFLEVCYMYPEIPLYGDITDKVADVLFSGDIEAVLRYTKTEGAVYSNGKLFSAQWLDKHTIEDYIAEGIDFAEIELSKEATLEAIRNFSKSPESNYEEKCSEYLINALSEK